MPPIVPLMDSAPPTSIAPDLVNPFPVMLYSTKSTFTPGATSRFNPIEPDCSSPPLPSGSLEQAMNDALTPSANKQTKGYVPNLVTSPDLPRNFFINRSFCLRRQASPLGQCRTTKYRRRWSWSVL